MIPRLTIASGSQPVAWPINISPQPPKIALGDLVTPASPPNSVAGWQIVVIQGGNITDPQDIVLNNYYTVPDDQLAWTGTYTQMYDQIVADVVNGDLNQEGNLLIAVSFGLDQNMCPSSDMVSLLQSAGAAGVVQSWVSTSDCGSGVGNPNIWVNIPAAYACVGTFGHGADSAAEVFQNWSAGGPVSLNLAVFFFFE